MGALPAAAVARQPSLSCRSLHVRQSFLHLQRLCTAEMAAAPAEQRPAVLALTRLLDAPLQARRRRSRAALGSPAAQQVELSDGRLLYGQLQCADKQGNLVLHSTREVLPKRCVLWAERVRARGEK